MNLSRLFGSSPEVRILEFLLKNKHSDFNISEVARGAGVGRSNASLVIHKFCRLEFVSPSNRKFIGMAKVYCFDHKHFKVIFRNSIKKRKNLS